MADKSDYLKVASAQMLRVSSKQEKPGQSFNFDSRNKKKGSHNSEDFLNGNNQNELSQLDPQHLIELGRLILNKRNTELKLFLRIKRKKNGDSTEFYKLLETDILLIKSRLAEIEKQISDFDFLHLSQDETEEEDEVLEKLSGLQSLYEAFLGSAKKENDILLNSDIDLLDIVLKEKEESLSQIEKNQKNINYDIFKKYSQDYPKKVKANAILADIHNIMDEIVKIEDQNSVELQNAMDELKEKLSAHNRKSEAISKYSSGNVKSHFINTTK